MSLNDNDPTFPNLGDLAGERAVLADLHDEMQRLAVLSGSIDDLLASVLDCSDEEFDGLQAKLEAALVDLKAARQRVHALMERLGEAQCNQLID